jgi:hypothetical protein
VTINGTVNTGTVTVGILDVGTTDSGTTLDPRVIPQNVDNDDGFDYGPWLPATNDLKNVGSAISIQGDGDGDEDDAVKCTCNGVDYYGMITESIDNAYPFYNPAVMFDIVSCGSIPIRIDNVILISSEDEDDEFDVDCLAWNWTIVVPTGIGQQAQTITGSGSLEDFVAAIKAWQLEPCQVLHVTLGVIFLECTPQDSDFEFTIVITGSQWNEVAAPI